MLELFKFILSIFLIITILLSVSKENAGLNSFSTKTNLLGSPTSSQRFLNTLIIIAILIFVVIAIYLNLRND